MEALTKPLNIDPFILLANGILFLVLLQIMSRLFWKPMMDHLDRRKEQITNAYRTVDDTRREMENLRSEYQGRIAEIEAEARGRIQETVLQAQRQREEMLARARAEAETAIRRGDEEIEKEKAFAIVSMQGQLGEVASDTLAKALGALPDAAQRRLVEEHIAQQIGKT
jgi:F-type H+-transporting ATPase subunit b